MNEEIAIILAAGLGSRMGSLTKKVPKPLLKVNGVPLIETVIDGLEKRSVKKIYIVVGYLGDQFQYLTQKYPNIEIIKNKEYLQKNNISSLRAVGNLLGSADCFICEADLFVSNVNIFRKAGKSTCYFGKMVEGYSEDWAFAVEEERIVGIKKGAKDTYNMVGISFWSKNDAKQLKRGIDEAYKIDGHEKLFWDEIVDQLLDEIDVRVCEVPKESIVEVDTKAELRNLEQQLRMERK